jgi:hypothetical protein
MGEVRRDLGKNTCRVWCIFEEVCCPKTVDALVHGLEVASYMQCSCSGSVDDEHELLQKAADCGGWHSLVCMLTWKCGADARGAASEWTFNPTPLILHESISYNYVSNSSRSAPSQFKLHSGCLLWTFAGLGV